MLINNCGKPLIICNYAFAKNNKYYIFSDKWYFKCIKFITLTGSTRKTKIEHQQPFPVLAPTITYSASKICVRLRNPDI